MALSPDISGLRRRSPNPDSPHLDPNDGRPIQSYSPSLLSPYTRAEGSDHRLPSPYAPSRRSTSSLFSLYTAYGDATPTIRLVPSHSETDSDPRHITLNTRSKSNDIDDRVSGLSSPSLRRHETEPSYARMERSTTIEEPYTVSRNSKDRPLPPLPLNPRRKSLGAFSMTSSVITTPSEAGRSEISGISSADAASAGTGRRTWRSLLVNPFKDSPDRRSHSTRSFAPIRLGSRVMSRMSRSAASEDTLIESPYTLDKMAKTASEDTLVDDTMKRIRSTEGGDKILQKIPERLVENVKEGWTSFKVVLLLSVLTLFGYGLAGLCWTMQIMLRISPNSDVTMVTDPDVVIFLLFFSLLALFTSFVGLTGTLLNSRPILAFYCLLLWPTFISLALVGYSSFKRADVQLDRKLNQVWSQFLSEEDRLRIQNGLGCCGYYNPFHDATYSKRCYPRTPLAGCKGKWTAFEDAALRSFARSAFSTVPIHLVNIAIALICSNHVDTQFGKGLTPLRYRLQAADVRFNALAVLASLPLEPKPSRPSSIPLQRRSALRSSRSSVRSTTSTVRLVDPYHQPKARQYSSDSILKDYEKSPPIPFASGQKDVVMHRRATEDFGLPTPPTSRLSSLNYGTSNVKDPKRRTEEGIH